MAAQTIWGSRSQYENANSQRDFISKERVMAEKVGRA
jgi:hypothetical protein